MTLSSFALISGVICYLVGLPAIFVDTHLTGWTKKLLKDAVLLRLVGIAVTVLAVLTLRRQAMLSSDGEGIVVLLAWLTLGKGLAMSWWPEKYGKWKASMIDRVADVPALEMTAGIALVALGGFLTYMGWVLP